LHRRNHCARRIFSKPGICRHFHPCDEHDIQISPCLMQRMPRNRPGHHANPGVANHRQRTDCSSCTRTPLPENCTCFVKPTEGQYQRIYTLEIEDVLVDVLTVSFRQALKVPACTVTSSISISSALRMFMDCVFTPPPAGTVVLVMTSAQGRP
jgi:hypothetical protein